MAVNSANTKLFRRLQGAIASFPESALPWGRAIIGAEGGNDEGEAEVPYRARCAQVMKRDEKQRNRKYDLIHCRGQGHSHRHIAPSFIDVVSGR